MGHLKDPLMAHLGEPNLWIFPTTRTRLLLPLQQFSGEIRRAFPIVRTPSSRILKNDANVAPTGWKV